MLLALVLVVSMKTEIIKFNPDELIPTEKGKIENYVTSCIDKVGDDALFIIGLQGGYINISEDTFEDTSKSLKLTPWNAVPFWAYGTNTNIPSLQQIKIRIDKYIEDNLRSCMFDLEAFQETYDLVEKSEITSDTEIVESRVIFNVNWDLEIRNKAGEVVTEVIDHTSESDIKLKKIHRIAEAIVNKEMNSMKIEDIVQDLIALEHPKVPLNGMEINCNKRTWDVKEVQTTLLDMIRINVNQLKIKGTSELDFPESYYPEFEDGLTYYQNHYLWDLGEEIKVPEVSVTFDFNGDNYPYYFLVTPLVSGKMKSSQLGGSDILSFLCIQNWKFTYDMTFPILTTLRDETTGYHFNLAFTAHLVKNMPYRGKSEERPSYFVDTITDEDYCKDMRIPMTVKTYEYVENNDGVSYHDDLGGVNISFSCLRYKCEMGETEYDFAGLGFSGLNTNFPYCAGGILRVEKDGYKEAWQRVVTSVDEIVEMDLIPLYKFPLKNIKVVKHEINGKDENGNYLLGPALPLTDGEQALIKFKHNPNNLSIAENAHEETFVVNKGLYDRVYEQEQKGIEPESAEFLAKADFEYQLEINLLDDEKFIGGYKGNWTVDWSSLQNSPEIIFHLITINNPTQDEMFELILGLSELSTSVPEPEIK